MSGGLTFGSVVRLNAEAVMKTEKDAQSLVQLVKFMSTIGNSGMGQVKQLLQNADAHAQGTTVVFSTSATEADLEQILGFRKKTASLFQ